MDRRGKCTHDYIDEVEIAITATEKATKSHRSGCVPGFEGGSSSMSMHFVLRLK